MDDKRVADYFVVAGLLDNATPLEEFSRDGNCPKTTHSFVPITDVTVIIRSQGEMIPKGYQCIETTPSGFNADLNHGSLRSPNIYFCYRRGRDKPPLVDVGVLYEGKEKVMADSEVVLQTPYHRSANVNNSGSKTFITYRRASENAPCNQLVVTDICVILANKGENPPHAFCKIDKNLNKGVLGSDVYLCYKKSMNRPDLLCYKPGILGRFPFEDYELFPLPQTVPLFCLPMGASIECWPRKAQQPKPIFSTFVLTSNAAEKVYGAAVNFYEIYPESKLNDDMKLQLNYSSEDQKDKQLHTNKSICLLSRWPFFDTFEKFLRYLHRMSISGPHKVPLERIISHFMLEVPFPSLQRPRILIQLSDCTISLSHPEDTQLPLTGASFIQLLKSLGPHNCLKILLLALTEQKILFHSLRPDVLTSVAEAVVMIIFPFHWQCPYIPLCPLGLSDVLSAPMPFLVGVDSRYFDLYDPPHDVICVDLDTNSIYIAEEKRNLNIKLFPKRPARILHNSLQNLYKKLSQIRSNALSTINPGNNSTYDYDFKIKRKERLLELEIQEAFLHFMASILKGYRSFLLPITTAPTIGTTDPNSLFDLTGFLRSRDKTYSRFFALMMKTQMFIRFIEERSFVSDKDASLAFFDECTEKIESSDGNDSKFLDIDDSHTSDRTVFIAPPEPIGLPPGLEYSYKQFGTLKPQLFHKNPAKSLLSLIAQASPVPSSPMARRTKQEIRSAQKIAKKQSETPVMWAKCLVGYCFSLWFIHLPSFVKSSLSKSKALRLAFEVLVSMQRLKVSQPDEVCYRVLMLLCGLYSQPTLAVKVLFEMKRHGVQPNAITYGYYNKAVLESKWPAADASSTLMWNRLRNVIIGVAQFRQGVKKKARRSLSLCSESELDRISRTSTESGNADEITLIKITNPADFVPDLVKLIDDKNNIDGLSDRGYSSMNHVDRIKSSPVSEEMVSDETKQEDKDLKDNADICDEKNKQEKNYPILKTLRFKEIDFSESDNFRCRIGSIIKSSATSIDTLTQFQDCTVDSSAGILMTSRTNLDDTKSNSYESEIRRRHRSAGDCTCHISKSFKLNTCNSPLSEVPHEYENKTFFRSYSFGNDAQIIKKIKGTKENNDNELLSKWLDSPLKKSLYDKKKEEKDKHSKSFGLTRCDEEPEIELDVPFSHRPRSPCIPIEKQRKISSGSKCSNISSISSEDSSTLSTSDTLDHKLTMNETSAVQDKDFFSSTFSPLKDAWLNWDFSSSAIPRVTSNITTTIGNVYRESFRRKNTSNKVSRSSTFHNGSRNSLPKIKPRKESLGDLNLDESKKSMSRSSTLPMPPKSTETNQEILSHSPGQGFPISSSNFGISRLTSKHSEVLFDSLKSAVTSVSSKLNEFRSSLSASNTPTKYANNSSTNQDEINRLTSYEDGLFSDGCHISLNYSGYNSLNDSVLNSEYNKEKICLKHKSHLPHVGSAPVFSSYMYETLDLHNNNQNENISPKIAIEITMTTCSRCFTCSSLLYDEEIMEGWSADESNLNTQCTFCKAKFVPLLTIFIKDFRWENTDENYLTPAQSSESIQSIPSASRQCLFDPLTGNNHPKSLNEKDSHINRSIDSNNEFILFEPSPENEEPSETVQQKNLKNKSDCQKEIASSNCSHNSTSSSLEENDYSLSILRNDPKFSKLSQSSYSSGSDRRFSTTLSEIEPITVPYLSPLVLRKEVENVLEHEGDNCMTKPEFVDQHPIIYWNLLWFFKRIGLATHLPSILLSADSITKGKQIPLSWEKADGKNVIIFCVWDNIKLHEDMGQPFYLLWSMQENENKPSSLVTALITDERKASKNVMKQILGKLQCNDLYTPICILMNERHKGPLRKHYHSIYREILFLSFVAIGREDIDNLSFDLEYRKAFAKLSNKQLSQLHVNDKPPAEGAVFCRRYFKDLELRIR